MEKPDVYKNTDIEVLRAVAISFTLISHLIWGIVPKLGGVGRKVHGAFQFWTGVDLFFAISGFLITSSLLRSWRLSSFGAVGHPNGSRFFQLAAPFWIRRAFRLLPSAWLWIALTLGLAAFFNANASLGSLRENLHEAAAALLNVANIYYYNWFADGHSAYGAFGVYWSLSLEEQFYLLFPFLLFFVRRRFLVPTLIAVFSAQVLINRPSGFHPHPGSLLWFVRTDALILGVLLAFWQSLPSYRAWEPRWLRRPVFSLPAIALGIVLLAALPAVGPTVPFATGLVAVVSGLLVFLASYDRNYVLPASPFKTALVWLGSRSYSIYLIHTTGRSLVLEMKINAGIAAGSVAAAIWTFLSLVVILLLAELNYRFVETPGRKFGRRLAARRWPRPEAASLPTPANAFTD